MVDIDLFNKDEKETKKDYEVTVNKSEFQDYFHKVNYKITFKTKFEYSLVIWLTSSSPYNINFKFRNDRNPFSYYVRDEEQIVREVETYFSDLNPNVPLIIGFKLDNSEFKYYTFLSLTKEGSSYGLPSNNGFGPDDLVKRLKSENDKRNKIKYITRKKWSQNYNTSEHLEQGVKKYSFTAKDDESYQDHQIETNHLLSKGLLDRTIIEKILDEMKDKTFNSINVYSSEKSKMALLFEFVSETIKVRFERKDNDGYYWEKTISPYNYRFNSGPDLKNLQSQYETRITYQLDKNSSINSGYKKIIEVTKDLKTDTFTVYSHRPKNLESISVTYVLYNDKAITIVANEKITSSQGKLEPKSIQNSKFTEAVTYVLSENTKEHLLIKLTKDDNTIYYIHRFNKNGTKWRQVSRQELKDSGIDVDSLTDQDFGKTLDELLSGSSKSINLKKLLDFINSEVNSIIVVLETKSSSYGRLEIEKIVGTSPNEKYVPPMDIDNNNINVNNDTDISGSCLKGKRYYVYKHSLTGPSGDGNENGSTLYLKFFVHGKRISLHKSIGNRQPTYLTYTPGKNVYVYFYGEFSTRPLLLCYKDESFKANDKDSYYSIWILDNNIKQCACKGTSESDHNNKKLLTSLGQTIYSNVLYLYEKTSDRSDYQNSKLFYSYYHRFSGNTKSDIEVYKKSDGKKIIIKRKGMYNSKEFTRSEVYFNRYEEANTPLVVVLTFRDINQKPYYELSKFENDIGQKAKHLTDLKNFDHGNFLDVLISENDQLKDLLTYEVGTQPSGSSSKEYNLGKIRVTDDSRNEPQLSDTLYKRYKHTPKPEHVTKKSCVIYKKKPLFSSANNRDEEITEIQREIVKCVNVYFSSKYNDKPLLVGVQIQKDTAEWKYYYQKKYGRSLYWKKVNKEETFELLGYHTEDNNIHKELIEKTEKLIEILDKVEFFLYNTVLLLIEKTTSYLKVDVENAFSKTEPKFFYNPKVSDAQPDTIDLSKERCLELETYGYHLLSHSVRPNGSPDTAELRLLIPTSSGNGRYSEIKLYNSESSGDRIKFKYSKDQSKLYVYFYGDDPRPLLLSYNGAFYRPKDKTDYDIYKWIKVDVITRESSSTNDSLPKVLTEVVGYLTKVMLEHNHDRDPYTVHQFNGREIQVMVTSQKIIARELSRQSCYKKVTHRPNGYGSTSGSDFRLGDITYSNSGSSSSINYYANGPNQSSHKWKPLVKVISYFYDKDENYKNPLLIELEFKANRVPVHKEFYSLSKTQTRWEWQRDSDAKGSVESGGEKLIKYLEAIRHAGKKVVQVRIDKANAYDMKASKQTAVNNQFVSLDNITQIQVSQETPCKDLKGSNYKCLKHKLSE